MMVLEEGSEVRRALKTGSLFYKKGMSGEIFPRQAESRRELAGIQPLDRWRRLCFPSRKVHAASLPAHRKWCPAARFTSSLSLLSGCVRQNGPEPSRARR